MGRKWLNDMKKSPLAEEHIKLGARMAGFAGWEMPIQYEGIVAEHHAVRRGAGVFDISHMGQFFALGEIAGDWLNYLLTPGLATRWAITTRHVFGVAMAMGFTMMHWRGCIWHCF